MGDKTAQDKTLQLLEKIVRRLNVLTGLSLQPPGQELGTRREQYGFLSSLGLGPTDIAEIYGVSNKTVSSELSKFRKQKSKK